MENNQENTKIFTLEDPPPGTSYTVTPRLRYVKIPFITGFMLKLQQMWQGSDGSAKWEWIEEVEENTEQKETENVLVSLDLLKKTVKYVEKIEEECDSERGGGRTIDELIEENCMPEVYLRLRAFLKSKCKE